MANALENIGRGKIPGKWDDLEPLFEKEGMTPEWAVKLLKECCEISILNHLGNVQPNLVKARTRSLETWAKWSGMQPPERIFVSGTDCDYVFKKADSDA